MVKRVVQSIVVGGEEIKLENEMEIEKATVTCGGREWSTKNLASLLQEKGAELVQHPDFLAKIFYYMTLQDSYILIEDVEAEKNIYRLQSEHEKANSNKNDYWKVSQYGGPYNIDELHTPEVKNQVIEFYVEQNHSRVPMRVRIPLSYQSGKDLEIRPISKLKRDKGCEIQ
jgi:hypothetical protein